jgi:type I restriction enzyme S subunit
MRLPDTWKSISLSDLCAINPVFDNSDVAHSDAEVTFVPMSAIDEFVGEITKAETRRYKEVAKGYTAFQDNDVLYAKITPCMENGKVAIAKELIKGIGFGSTEFHVLRPTEQILSEYLFYFLRQPWFRHRAKSAFTGSAGQLRVPENFMARTKIPLPTLPEQGHVVSILKKADEIQRLRRETMDEAQKLYRTLYVEMFGHPLSPRNTWKMQRLGDICNVSYGLSEKLDTQLSSKDGHRIITISNVTLDGELDLSVKRYSDPPVNNVNDYRLLPLDLLFNWRNGSPEHVGKTGIWEQDGVEAVLFVSFLLRIRSDTNCIEPYFLWALLNLLRYSGTFKASGREQINTKFNAQELSSLRIPVPPIDLQKVFAGRLFSIRGVVARMRDTIESTTKALSCVRAQLFSGELTEQWRQSHRKEIDAAVHKRDEALGIKRNIVIIKEFAPEHRPWMMQTERMWMKDQMSELQYEVWSTIRSWKGTVIPSEHLDEFVKTWTTEHLENAKEQVIRALNQLAGLGLIAKISIPNEDGEYVTGFRGFREEELSRTADLEALVET